MESPISWKKLISLFLQQIESQLTATSQLTSCVGGIIYKYITTSISVTLTFTEFKKVCEGNWSPGTVSDKDVLKFLKPMSSLLH